jgi:hypothetical protein
MHIYGTYYIWLHNNGTANELIIIDLKKSTPLWKFKANRHDKNKFVCKLKSKKSKAKIGKHSWKIWPRKTI